MADEPANDRSESQIDRVRKWLNREGYPFELEIGRQLAEGGVLDLEHGHLYRDLETGKWREVDIIGFLLGRGPAEPERSQPPFVKVRFVVECKYDSKPWVVLASRSSTAEQQFPSRFLLGELGSRLVEAAEFLYGTGVKLNALGLGATRGHGVVQALRPPSARRNKAYSAVRSVIAAAGAEAAAYDAAVGSGVQLPPNPRLSLVMLHLPVIVFRGSIFELSLKREGRQALREVESAVILAPGPHGRASTALVRIVKPGGPLKELVQSAASDAAFLAHLLRPKWEEHAAWALDTRGGILTPAQAHLEALKRKDKQRRED